MRISDWSSDVCSSDLMWGSAMPADTVAGGSYVDAQAVFPIMHFTNQKDSTGNPDGKGMLRIWDTAANPSGGWVYLPGTEGLIQYGGWNRSEEHTSELQSLMRISYAVF